MGFAGADCEVATLPACMLGAHAIPIRSWVLHAFHDNAGHDRYTRREPANRGRGLGPVPCACLQQLVATPYMLERSRLMFMRGWTFRCIDLPPQTSLAAFVDSPAAFPEAGWRLFSFEAAHDALRLGAEPSLSEAQLDPEQPWLPGLIRAARGPSGQQYPPTLEIGSSGWLFGHLRERIQPLLVPKNTGPATLPLLPLSRCRNRCGGVGWCESAGSSGVPRCGCFVPGGLKVGVGGGACEARDVYDAAKQPPPHWGPPCPLGCSGHGRCDWQGFCRCDVGFWGIDCAITWTGRQPGLMEPSIEELARGGGGGGGGGWWRRRRRVGASRQPRQRVRPRPRIYVHDLPAELRFGVDFAANVDQQLLHRLLRSAHRAATPQRADYIYIPGPPLVIDGHRLLARLWHALDAHGGWNRTNQVSSVRFVMSLLTERASMDSFQVSYSDEDREEWPALKDAPHVRSLRKQLRGCYPAAPSNPANMRDNKGRVANLTAEGVAMTIAAGDLQRTRALLEVALHQLRRRRRAPLLGSLYGGGFVPSTSRCKLPADVDPASPTRRWMGLQFNGNRGHPVYFQRGKDVALPQLLLLDKGGSHADQPSCERMNASSPFSAHFGASSRRRHEAREHLLWFGGHGGHNDARTKLFDIHAASADGRRPATPGFALLNTLRTKERRNAVDMALSSVFCWVPRGQGQGDPTRHMVAIYHGCLPVFSLGRNEQTDDALPFEELLDWSSFSRRVPTQQPGLGALPDTLWPIVRDEASLRAMQRELACSWRPLFWTSLVGSCFGEGVLGDAFATLMQVLKMRLATRRGGDGAAGTNRSRSAPGPVAPCSLLSRTYLPPHLARAIDAPPGSLVARQLAPGASPKLSALRRWLDKG